MEEEIKVSVIIPVYNVMKYLRQSVESVMKQTLRDIEIICIDDGSIDLSGKILDEYVALDSRIQVIHKENTGYGCSMNIGLRVAQGKYISIIESDDYAEPTMLEVLYRAAEENNAEITKANYYEFSHKEDIYYDRLENYPKNRVISYENYPSLMMIADSIWSALYRRKFLEENNIWFNETPGASFQDTSFAAIGWLYAKRVYFVADAVLHYRRDNFSSSIHAPGKVFCICDEWKRVEKLLDSMPDRKGIVKYYQVAMKYQGYVFNYNRLSACYQYALLIRMEEELKKDNENGYIKEEYFSTYVWKYVSAIMDDKDKFFDETSKFLQDERMEGCNLKNNDVYVEAFIDRLKTSSGCRVYGAGAIGKALARRLLQEDVRIDAFVVTDMADNNAEVMGIPVQAVQDIQDKEAPIVIAVKGDAQGAIYYQLMELNFENVFYVDKLIMERVVA